MNSGTVKKCNGSAAAESRRACAETGFPSGNGFMPQVRLNRLVKMAGRTKEGVEKFRLLAARMRKEGKSIREIAYGLCKPYSTVRDWLLRMHAYGPKGRFSRKRRGRRRMLGNADLKRLNRWLDDTPEKHGFKSLSWQFDMILKLIKRELGVACSWRTLQRVLRKIHFSYRKRRNVPHNSASEEVQEKFRRGTCALIEGRLRDGYAVATGDEGTVQRSPSNGYGWRRTGWHDTVLTSFSKESVKVFCAVGEGRLHVWTADATNSKTFVTMLRRPHRKYPKFVMVLDNASYHKSATVRKYVESIKRNPRKGMDLIFLPPYAPQLNPTETQLRVLKNRLAGRYFDSVDELKNTIMSLVHRGEARPVKLMDYLRPGKGELSLSWNNFIRYQFADCA